MKKSKKILIPVSIVVVLIAIVLVVVMMNRGHRVIKVESVEGEVELDRGSAVKEVFEDMNLRSEDMVTTGEDGLLELRADEDKYIVAIENTCFEIVSKGNAKEGRLKIKLKYGTSLIEIENKLPESDNGNSVSREAFSKMGYNSRVAFKQENPELYNQMMKG